MKFRLFIKKYIIILFAFLSFCFVSSNAFSAVIPQGTIIKKQSFKANFKNFKRVKFASYSDDSGMKTKVHFYLLRNGKVVLELPNTYGNQHWSFSEVVAISFRDVNADGLKDIIVMTEYMTGMGPTGAQPFSVHDVYFQGSNKFFRKDKISELLNSSKNRSRLKTTRSIVKYLRSLNRSKASSSILSKSKTNRIFTRSVKNRLGINFPIFRTYQYSDQGGKHYLVLTEKPYKRRGRKFLNRSIKAFSVKVNRGRLVTLWKMTDFRYHKTSRFSDEKSIWFWTKYFKLKDFDNDGFIDPILIYGTSGLNNYDDGRLKILVYYKGKKVGIRHQNDLNDDNRLTKVDRGFYQLPIQIQTHVKNVMKRITGKYHSLFPTGYREQMNQKRLLLKE